MAFTGTSPTRSSSNVVVNTVGGREASRSGVLDVTDANLKAALETSLVESGLFRRIGTGGYSLQAFIVELDQPAIGLNMTTDVKIDYSLKRGSSVVWAKTISSSYTATIGDEFVGVTRVRVATEGAVRKNIEMAITQMARKVR